jgi:hypothetical protein
MRSNLLALALGSLTLTACPPKNRHITDGELTLGEAAQAVEESAIDAEASSITSNTIEISTSFTLGSAVEAAASEVKTFIETQLPCAEVALQGAKLSVEYGKKPGLCLYRGQSYKGTHTIELKKTAPGEVEVQHTWASVSNQRVKVDGVATVTWSSASKSRRIQHEFTWTRLSDNRTGKGSGDRVQTPLEGGVAEGIKIEGARSWTGEKGTWDLAIRGIEVRWADPVPQAGSYTLLAPSSRSMNLAFARLDSDTIQVTVSSGERSFNINVTSPAQTP